MSVISDTFEQISLLAPGVLVGLETSLGDDWEDALKAEVAATSSAPEDTKTRIKFLTQLLTSEQFLNAFTRADLTTFCNELGLATTGGRQAMVDRIYAYFAEKQNTNSVEKAPKTLSSDNRRKK